MRPVAPGAWLVVDVDPEKWKFAEVVADLLLLLEFLKTKFTVRAAAVVPIRRVVMEVVTFDE